VALEEQAKLLKIVKALQEEIANLKLGIKPKNYWTLAKADQLKKMQEDRINTDFEIQALRKQLVFFEGKEKNLNTTIWE
jgi:hypothetical protein